MRDPDNNDETMDSGTPSESSESSHFLKNTRRRFLVGAAGLGALSTVAAGTATPKSKNSESSGGEESGDAEADRDYSWQPTAYDITASDGLRLRVWKQSQGEPVEAVLFVHGATYGAISMFDPPVADNWDGWMDYASGHEQAAFAIDIRGYGDSERPSEFEKPPEESDPVVPASVAARDLRDTLEWIHNEQGFSRVHLVGLSSGTWRVRALFSEYDPDVATVTLAAGSLGQFEAPTEDQPAWTTQVKSEFEERWRAQVPEDADPDDWIGGEDYSADRAIDSVWTALYKSGQAIPDADEPTILNPTNLLQDEEHPPEDISVPTLVIRGSSDLTIPREGALRLYDAVGAPEHRKQYGEIAGGTHFLFLEDRRFELYEATYDFQTP